MKYEITKGSEKDFEGAPEWVMQVESLIDSNALFYTEAINGSQTAKHLCQWSDEFITRQLAHSANSIGGGFTVIAQRRPITEPVWNGEGLPPVGSRIQYSCIKFDENRPAIESGKWYGGTVIAYHDGAVWTSDNGIRHLSNTIFRPIRSPEDVARDEFIKELSGIVIEGSSIGTKFAAALYDAGYRKVDGE